MAAWVVNRAVVGRVCGLGVWQARSFEAMAMRRWASAAWGIHGMFSDAKFPLRRTSAVLTSIPMRRMPRRLESSSNELTEQKMKASFVCTECNTRNTHTFSKDSYENGVVLGRCPGCKKLHLIADNLKWFSDKKKTLETILNDRAESFAKFSNAKDFEEAVREADATPKAPDGNEKQ